MVMSERCNHYFTHIAPVSQANINISQQMRNQCYNHCPTKVFNIVLAAKGSNSQCRFDQVATVYPSTQEGLHRFHHYHRNVGMFQIVSQLIPEQGLRYHVIFSVTVF